MDGGEAILEAFRKLKIDYIMSSPGSEWSPIWEALVRQKIGNRQGPTYIDAWHETLAVNLATGYTLMTGRPQAVLVHAGVGLLQGSMGVHGALQSEVPMLVMSGESQTLGENPDLDIEQQWYGGISVGGAERYVENITKWARQVTSPYTLYESVIRAGEMAQRTPKGPIYLNVALEHMLHDWTPPANERDVPFAPRVQAHPSEVEKVASLLLAAKNPIIVAEQSGRDPAAFTALVELADLLGIPVTWSRGSNFANFPTDHPLYLGVANYKYLEDADLILLVGGRIPWYPPHVRPGKGKIVAINENQFKGHMIYQQLHADLYLEGEIAASLQALAQAARASKIDAATVKARREKWTREHDAFVAGLNAEKAKARGNGKAIDPLDLIATLGEVMPADTIFVDETILHGPVLRQHLPFTTPQSFFRGFGGLGQGIGTALGVKLAAPERPVALLIGDGGFLYNPVIQALGASKQHNLPILIVVFNNKGYMAMQKGHVHHYPDGAAENANMHLGSKLNAPDFAELGSHFGLHGERVEQADKLKGALQTALKIVQGGTTAILNVMVSR
ncbi:MAG TPA: thiamine pyrophosphate-dependent enzyme [Xanthobacteraceae bacterium]|nr:thiamine pyrophosphate-dependent enzyme [Xanthobacteraceae bacterium]